MEVLKNFGFEPVYFTAQIINFLILAFVFKKYLYKPILKVLKDRQSKIEQSLIDAQKTQEALEEADTKRNSIVKRATVEGQNIIEEAKQGAEILKNEIIEKSKKDAEKIINDAREQTQIEMQKAISEVENMALSLSQKVIERALSEFFTKEEKDKILKKSINSLSNQYE